MTSRNKRYHQISSFKDFENEKYKLHYQIKLSEKKLEIKYLEFTSLLHPSRLVPIIISEWITPLFSSIKNWFSNFFGSKNPDNTTNNQKEMG